MYRSFTLLEVMIALVLVGLAASFIGIRISKVLEEKRFQTAIDRLYLELEACRFQALNMQADFTVILKKKQGSFVLERTCPEMRTPSCTVQWESPCNLFWNGERTQAIALIFSSTGQVLPTGSLEFISKKQKKNWEFPDLFALSEKVDEKLKRPS